MCARGPSRRPSYSRPLDRASARLGRRGRRSLAGDEFAPGLSSAVKGGGPVSVVATRTMSTSTKQADRELSKFNDAHREAERVAAANSFLAISAEAVLKTFSFPIEPTAEDFQDLYQLRHERYINICSFLLSIKKEDGKTEIKVPVTPKNQKEPKKQSYHSISIHCANGAILEILIRENDNYVVGFRVYLTIQAKDETPWRTFGDEVPTRLGNSQPTKYTSQHVMLGKMTAREIGRGCRKPE
ncbi:hypothetical protein ZWY2020_025529 [Hordeum vulgare]|nr:hypothetical protein ZWY2020_025529 [Hordeum vulgare]